MFIVNERIRLDAIEGGRIILQEDLPVHFRALEFAAAYQDAFHEIVHEHAHDGSHAGRIECK